MVSDGSIYCNKRLFLGNFGQKGPPLMICDGIGVPGADADDDDNEYDGDESMQW